MNFTFHTQPVYLFIPYFRAIMEEVVIVECPRDAMQGIHSIISTNDKVKYLNQLLKVGFDILDCGSFVSPKIIPQMADTHEVMKNIQVGATNTKLSVIVPNLKGVVDACVFPHIDIVGYPFSISETFQLRNTNSSIQYSLEILERIQEEALIHNKKVHVYLSMAFGNPYNDPWDIEVIEQWVDELVDRGFTSFSLSDTVGVADETTIREIFPNLLARYPGIEFGAHFHTNPTTWRDKILPAWESGCRRFDTAIKGFGGCPMAKDELVGNMPTESFLQFMQERKLRSKVKLEEFQKAFDMAQLIFPLEKQEPARHP